MYRLTKIDKERDKFSRVGIGHTQSGDVLRQFDNDRNIVERDNLDDLMEGQQVIVIGKSWNAYLITSPIKRFLERSSKRVVFETQTSTYELINTEIE